ncbi:hypothetical protein A3Q56_07128 [Intoshia linei]|uniref:MAM domain-containing protein n=1 Tax=Intoshia linei TaxID=1819745 RepID=A0A177AT23_9BILA|nr:hypothetical protein A3Q56_07128 [Intoshia linei]
MLIRKMALPKDNWSDDKYRYWESKDNSNNKEKDINHENNRSFLNNVNNVRLNYPYEDNIDEITDNDSNSGNYNYIIDFQPYEHDGKYVLIPTDKLELFYKIINEGNNGDENDKEGGSCCDKCSVEEKEDSVLYNHENNINLLNKNIPYYGNYNNYGNYNDHNQYPHINQFHNYNNYPHHRDYNEKEFYYKPYTSNNNERDNTSKKYYKLSKLNVIIPYSPHTRSKRHIIETQWEHSKQHGIDIEEDERICLSGNNFGAIGVDSIIFDNFCPPLYNAQNIWKCHFEDTFNPTMCNMVQPGFGYNIDQFDWTLNSESTKSKKTGPNFAQSGKYYIFIETSKPRNLNENADIHIPSLKFTGLVCFSIYYNMNGINIGTLSILLLTQVHDKVHYKHLWTKSHDQGEYWNEARIQIKFSKKHENIVIRGSRGNGYLSDIAIDTLTITPGYC